jgi:hypothetical protein
MAGWMENRHQEGWFYAIIGTSAKRKRAALELEHELNHGHLKIPQDLRSGFLRHASFFETRAVSR